MAGETNEDFSPTEPIPDGYCERQVWANLVICRAGI
jgi:hypothetical protein